MSLKSFLTKWLLMPLFARYVRMPGRSYSGKQPQLTPEQSLISAGCQKHIHELATVIGVRYVGVPGSLERSASYIESVFAEHGYTTTRHDAASMHNSGPNIVADLPGRSKKLLVIGAHYDTIPNCVGANDNGSGVAALLELARLLKGKQFQFTVRFVAFANEEHPNLPSEAMGSYAYAQHLKWQGAEVAGMWSLETIGCYSNAKDSQRYPFPFNLYYPNKGNFVAFVGNTSSKKFVHDSVRAFRKAAQFPSEGVTAPEKFKDVGRSDHWGFWQAGYPALMVTDTANFRYVHYHTTDDTADKINYEAMALVVAGLANTIPTVAS